MNKKEQEGTKTINKNLPKDSFSKNSFSNKIQMACLQLIADC
jgi:hypothetical protein